MIYRHEIKEEAELEALEAFLYYEEKLEGLGNKFLFQVEKYIKQICQNPLHFPLKNGYRQAFIKKFPYLIIYEFYQETVVVYSIFNTYQNPDKKP